MDTVEAGKYEFRWEEVVFEIENLRNGVPTLGRCFGKVQLAADSIA